MKELIFHQRVGTCLNRIFLAFLDFDICVFFSQENRKTTSHHFFHVRLFMAGHCIRSCSIGSTGKWAMFWTIHTFHWLLLFGRVNVIFPPVPRYVPGLKVFMSARYVPNQNTLAWAELSKIEIMFLKHIDICIKWKAHTVLKCSISLEKEENKS